MKLTEEIKDYINKLSYEQLLSKWRFACVGDSMFEGETGDYFAKRLEELRNKPETDHVAASKNIGWEK